MIFQWISTAASADRDNAFVRLQYFTDSEWNSSPWSRVSYKKKFDPRKTDTMSIASTSTPAASSTEHTADRRSNSSTGHNDLKNSTGNHGYNSTGNL